MVEFNGQRRAKHDSQSNRSVVRLRNMWADSLKPGIASYRLKVTYFIYPVRHRALQVEYLQISGGAPFILLTKPHRFAGNCFLFEL